MCGWWWWFSHVPESGIRQLVPTHSDWIPDSLFMMSGDSRPTKTECVSDISLLMHIIIIIPINLVGFFERGWLPSSSGGFLVGFSRHCDDDEDFLIHTHLFDFVCHSLAEATVWRNGRSLTLWFGACSDGEGERRGSGDYVQKFFLLVGLLFFFAGGGSIHVSVCSFLLIEREKMIGVCMRESEWFMQEVVTS